MTRARKTLVSIPDTPYYHVVSRCVRRAFLCGYDHPTGKNYEHRREWVANRIRLLSSVFVIDICSYAVMSNHYHVVVKLDPNTANEWDTRTVIERWLTLFKGPLLIQKYQRGESIDPAEQHTIDDIVAVWRNRLSDLSWFMKCLNEPIAKQANQEDGCSGHFWESRFKSQALLTEEALLSCMAYVDLNPVRAGIAKTPETSDFTSLQERVRPDCNPFEIIRNHQQHTGTQFSLPIKPLALFDGNLTADPQTGIPFHLRDYLELVDWTGRMVRKEKRGDIADYLPPILQRLQISPQDWMLNSQHFEKIFYRKFGQQKTPQKVGQNFTGTRDLLGHSSLVTYIRN